LNNRAIIGLNSNSSVKIYDKYANKHINAHSDSLPMLYFFSFFRHKLPKHPNDNPIKNDSPNNLQNVPNIPHTTLNEKGSPVSEKSFNISYITIHTASFTTPSPNNI
jgi:hypothetical protein